MENITIDTRITLNNGKRIPIFGLGTYLNDNGRNTVDTLLYALEIGYRHIDTAAMYINEKEVGQAIKESDIPREEIFVTTKLWNSDHGFQNSLDAFYSSLNKLNLDPKVQKFQHYLHTNFVGFLTEHKSTLILRNIARGSDFRYYKLRVQESKFMDFYKLNGFSKISNIVIIAEGIFDIFTEHIYDKLNLKKSCRLYASALSSKFSSLIKSIVFHEMIFKPEIHILSDNGIPLDNYKKLKYYNKHIIDKMVIYYNRTGKDFNDTPLVLEYFPI